MTSENDLLDLTGQVAIITGASSGIGAAVAYALDRAGMKLVLTGRNQAALDELAGGCSHAAAVVGDITDAALPGVLMETAQEAFGRCDVLVNNAGVMEVGNIGQEDIERICAMVRINVEAAYRMAYMALRHFKKQNRGYLINISSILGTKVRAGAGAYAGTKYAIEAFSEALRMELAGTGVRVTAVEPGLTQTHLQDHFDVHPAKMLGMSQMLKPEDIARTIRFVLQQPEHVRIPRVMVLPGEQAM